MPLSVAISVVSALGIGNRPVPSGVEVQSCGGTEVFIAPGRSSSSANWVTPRVTTSPLTKPERSSTPKYTPTIWVPGVGGVHSGS